MRCVVVGELPPMLSVRLTALGENVGQFRIGVRGALRVAEEALSELDVEKLPV